MNFFKKRSTPPQPVKTPPPSSPEPISTSSEPDDSTSSEPDDSISPPSSPQPVSTSPPSYSELGTQAMDLLQKGYLNGVIKLNCKTTNDTGMVFNATGSLDQQTEKSDGSLAVQYVASNGLIFSEKWSSENILSVQVESLRNHLMKDVEVVTDVTLNSKTGGKRISIRPSYFTKKFSFNFGLEVDQAALVFSSAAVLEYNGLLVGYHTAVDVGKCHVTANNFCLGYPTKDVDLCVYANGGQDFGASVYHQIRPGFEAALSLLWSSGKQAAKIEIGAKYQLHDDTILRAKFNNTTQIGLGYQQYVRKGVMLIMSAIIDCKDFENGDHMFGLALEFEPQAAM